GREPPLPLRELRVRVPVPRRLLVAVVELDIAEEPPVEVRGAELQVGDHVRLAHVAEQFVPAAPSGGGCFGREPLAVHWRGRDEQRGQRVETVTGRVVADPHAGGIALGTEWSGGEPPARGLQAVP